MRQPTRPATPRALMIFTLGGSFRPCFFVYSFISNVRFKKRLKSTPNYNIFLYSLYKNLLFYENETLIIYY